MLSVSSSSSLLLPYASFTSSHHMCNVFFALDTWAVALLATAASVVLVLSIFEPSQGFFAFYAGSVGPTGQCHPFQWGKEVLPCANEGIILP